MSNRYGKLLILKEERRADYKIWSYCRCDCGVEKWIAKYYLKSGKETCGEGSCRANYESDIGKKYHKLVVLKEARRNNNDGTSLVYCYCRCDCGNEKWIQKISLRNNATKSCGCLIITHKQSNNKLYSTWSNQKDRCYNLNSSAWKNYGGRGITVYDDWINDFGAWLKYVESLPHYKEKDRSLDRIDNDKGYEPGNLKWATKAEQSNNRRSNILITYNSETHTISEWASIIGMSAKSITSRLRGGWSIEKTLSTPNRTKSCAPHTTHGQSNTALYHLWSNIKDRCLNKNNSMWKDYGGRGIKICNIWANDFIAWKEYIEALPNYGEQNRSIDRIDNDKGYEPGNLRWATKIEQANNKRGNTTVTFKSETHTISEWSKLTGISASAIGNGLRKGWAIEVALTTPIKKINVFHESDFKI